MSAFADYIERTCLGVERRPAFSAHREDESHRIERLNRVFETASFISLIIHRKPIPSNAVVSLHDHKGSLTVTFLSDDWMHALKTCFTAAWEAENEPEIEFAFVEQWEAKA